MKLCVVSFKECWQDEAGNWVTGGGFPLQMQAIGSLFDDMTLVIVRGKPEKGGLPLPKHARVVALEKPTGDNARRKLAVVMHLPYYLRTIKQHVSQADVVHTPLPGDISLLGMLVGLVMRKRLIARYGGNWANTNQATVMTRVTKAFMRKFAGARNVMIATGDGQNPPAPHVRWLFSTALSEKEVAGIKPDYTRPLRRPARLAYVGRLSPEKGVAYLIEAIGLLKARGSLDPMPQLTLIGDGPQRSELEKLVQAQDCADCIHFAGQLDRKHLSELLLDMDLCVQPSLTESLAKAWLDAMAHGLPVIASEVGAARTVFAGEPQRGWLVPPGDALALADAIQCTLTSPVDWPVMRRNCRAYVENRTLEVWARRIGEAGASQWGLSLVDGRLR